MTTQPPGGPRGAVEVRSSDAGGHDRPPPRTGPQPESPPPCPPQLQPRPRAAARDRQSRRDAGAGPHAGPDRHHPDRRRGRDQGQGGQPRRMDREGHADTVDVTSAKGKHSAKLEKLATAGTRTDVKVTIAPVNGAGEELSVGGGTLLEIKDARIKGYAMKDGVETWRLAGFENVHRTKITHKVSRTITETPVGARGELRRGNPTPRVRLELTSGTRSRGSRRAASRQPAHR